ncbi:MAG: DUF3160 domain-containing protein [Anaerolineales bacterium]|jgi:hypothetical protein
MKTMPRQIVWTFLSLTLILSACNLPLQPTQVPQGTPSQPTQPSQTTPSPVLPPPAGIYPAPFSAYQEIKVKLPAGFAGGGYSLPLDLNQVQGFDLVSLTAAQRSLLAKNGFAIATPVADQYREFYQIYESNRYEQVPVFVTTDSVYHIYHLIFDKMLRDLETGSFIATLKTLTSSMLGASYQQYQKVRGTALEDPALRNVAYFAVAAQLLGLPDAVPAEASSLVSAELALINAAAGPAYSPIWNRPDLPNDMKLIEDYSQYIPRGHYTRSEDLKMYFRAMMWYGRMTFRMTDDFETRRALLLVQTMRSAKTPDGKYAYTLWENIYDPTVFIVGKADDLGYHEYGALSDQVFGSNPDPSQFADPSLFAQFKQLAQTLPPPQVNSMWVWIWQDPTQVTKGFRFMGQRFTLDAYVFGQVIWRKVGTQSDPRNLPKGLDFFAAMGSQEAYAILKDSGETQFANYDTQMTKVRNEVAALGTDSWTQNLYWSWLYSFQPLLTPKDNRYPPFMQTQAWARKDLQTALASWTELKHDTILYAKQVMAEMGGGAPENIPHGYVEPDPEAYARLLALAQMTESGLQDRGLLSSVTKTNLDNLTEELTFLEGVSEKELAGQPLTDDDYTHIMYWGGTLEQFTLAAADQADPSDRDLSDQKAALVADVATGPTDTGSLVALEEGEGQPTLIYVVLPDSPWRVAVGAVYSYYEFTVPADQRMTDETWQAMVEGGTNPAQPDWTKTFIAP